MKKYYKTLLPLALMSLVACGEKKAPDAAPAAAAPVAESTNPLLGPANIDKAKANPAAKRANAADTVVVGTAEAAGNFLPVYYATSYDAPVVNLAFEGLITLGKDGNYGPKLAEAMPEISADGKSYTFKIKKGVKFHSGNELTADDVLFTYNIIADKSYDGRMGTTVQDLVKDGDKLTGVEKIDDYTVKFTFKEALATNLINTGFAIMDSKFYAYTPGDLSPVKAKMQQISGTGPYKLTKFEPKQYFEMGLNENYWGNKPAIPKIIVKFVQTATEVQELIKGDIDILPGAMEPEKLTQANETGFIDRVQYLRHGYGYLRFNTQDPVVADKKVRQALTYGLDRASFIDLFLGGLGENVDAPVSKAWKGVYDKALEDKMVKYNYDPAKANALLDEAGWKKGTDGIREKDGKKMEIVWASIKDNPVTDKLTPILLENWKQLGVDVKQSPMDFNTLMDKVYKERTGFTMFNMATSESSFPYSGSSWLSEYNKTGGNNTAQLVDAKNDELLLAMKRELDPAKYKTIWQEWALNMNDLAPQINLYTNIYSDLVNRRITNFSTDSLWSWTSAILDAKIVEDK